MVSQEDVIAAYRLILGRDPENDSVVRSHMRALNVEQLRRAFIRSPEFQATCRSEARPYFPDFIDRAKPIAVEVKTDPKTLARLLERVQHSWTLFGQTEPHWSVLTNDLFKRQNFARNAESFYASGKEEVNRLDVWLDRNDVSHSGFDSCLELGCGTGRTTPWLAKRFHRVVACDISKPHLELAAEAARRHNVQNIQLVHVSTIDTLDHLPQVYVIFTLIVLQHNPPPVIYATLEKLLRLLKPGGVALFQVPTYGVGYRFDICQYLSRPKSQELEMHLIPQRYIFELVEAAGCSVLEVEPDLYISTMTTWISNTFLIRKR